MKDNAPTAVSDRAVNPFDAIAARMERLSGAMSQNDGVRIFNDLYLAVTRAVGAEFANDRFEDPAFLSRLAPIFSDLYFDAVERDAAKRTVSRVWVPLFEKRFQSGIAPLQFVIAGMNAHINYDLAIALVAASSELGYDLELDSAHHRDHLRVNTTLACVMDEVREHFETTIARSVVTALGMFDQFRRIARARENTWTQAQNLVALHDTPFKREQHLLARARTVGFVSRTLLGQCCAQDLAAAPASAEPTCSRPTAAWRRGSPA
ncbi:MAG: hypothetical protein QOF69_115 [Solirubrobacteraceae bacterium]|nr:hypothetical protein [Solirubrobacteraceae bacterium]